MFLYMGGCSHTVGTKKAFGYITEGHNLPSKLKEKLNCKVVCDAFIGNCNRQIIDSLVQVTSNVNTRPDYAIIQFSYPDRFRTPWKNKIGFKIQNPNVLKEYEDGSHDIRLKPDQGITLGDINFFEQYYLTNYTAKNLYLELTLDIKLVENHLKVLDIPYTFIIYPSLPKIATERTVFQSLDHSRILNFADNKCYNMETLFKSHEFKRLNDDGHFMEDAHEWLANAIIEHMEYGTKIRPNGEYDPNEKESIFTYI